MADKHVRFDLNSEWNGGRLTTAMTASGRRGVLRAGERLRALSVPLAPKDQGPLRESATVKGVPGEEPAAYVVFDTPYAAKQHEELDYRHTDGQAKYLEEPLNDHARELQGIIAQEIKIGITNA